MKVLRSRTLAALEFLPACGMDFRKAAIRAGYKSSYAQKLAWRFMHEPQLRELFQQRIQRLLEETGEADRELVKKILQGQHMMSHRINALWFLRDGLGIASK